MNKIGFPKRLSMGWTNYVRLMSLLVFLGLSLCAATAQDKVQLDVTRLTGADPADIINTDKGNTHRITPNNEQGKDTTFMLLNVGTQQFLNVGGSYSRHATLRDNGIYLWIYNNSKTPGTYNIRTRRNMKKEELDNKDSYVQYISDDPLMPGVYLDEQPEDVSRQFGWAFEKASGFSASNKVYKIKTYGDRYLTAVPNDANDNKCKAIAKTADNADYQVWKLVTLAEYLSLYKDSPSDSANPIDATFWFDTPEFGYNISNYGGWIATGGHSDDIYLGLDYCNKKITESYYKGDKKDDKQYIFDNSKYFCAVIKERHGIGLQQELAISQPGWYVVRCNGFSKTNGLAKLYIKEFWTENKYFDDIKPVSVTIKTLEETDGPTNMAEAGMAFYNGEYPNEAKIHITKDFFDKLESVGLQRSTSLHIGIEIDGKDTDNATGEWTAFDNFQLLYYGEEAEKPALVLDEENPDLNYLTETSDAYENVTLHLNRTFTLNKWNTLTLPVSLTYGQMKSTFGNDVLLAKLHELSATTVRFKTVDCTSDDEVMLEAFTPYIIKPTKAAEATTEAYTTPRLKKTPNQYWLADGVGETNAEDSKTRHISGKVKVEAGHYTIAGVTLNREALKANLDNHWVSTTTPSATTPSASAMTCKGTMVKTYYVDSNKKGMFYTDNGVPRDDLAGDYFMNNGTMWKVPATKQYGLKAFRCWFELSNTTDNASPTTAPAKEVSLFIDNIKDGVTGIDDITTDPNSSVAKSLNGVYNIYGQRVSDGSSLDNLPQGIYIVNGKKVKK